MGEYAGMADTISEREMKRQLELEDIRSRRALELYPKLSEAEMDATSAKRQRDLSDLQTIGPGLRDALGAVSPLWQEGQEASRDQLAHVNKQSALSAQMNRQALRANRSPLRKMLTRDATRDLALGRSLSAEQIREVTQATRESFSDRGMALGNPAIGTELLNRDAYGTQRQADRRAFAGTALQLGMAEDAQNRGFKMGVEGLNQQRIDSARNYTTQATQLGQSTLGPVLGMFGTRSPVDVSQPVGYFTSGQPIMGEGYKNLGPMLNYGSDLYNTNYNAQAAANLNSANGTSGLISGGIGAVGAVAGAALMMCWVAREIYGIDDSRWMIFRDWMLHDSPTWFLRLYVRHGERFARWLHTHPMIKAAIKPWFDARVRSRIIHL